MRLKQPLAVHILIVVSLWLSTFGLWPVSASPLDTPSVSPRFQVVDPDTPEFPVSRPEKEKASDEGDRDEPGERAAWFYGLRTAGTDPNFTVADAATLRAQAAAQAIEDKSRPTPNMRITGFSGNWISQGPNPIEQIDRTPEFNAYAVTGRVSALAIRSSAPYTIYLGGAQGGVWVSSTLTNQWIPKTDNLPSLAIGALALAPSNENIVYVGTGEGALSGDSYFGNGVLKSTDGGNTFALVSGSAFTQVSISRIVVDPTNPNTVYAAVLSGIAGQQNVRAFAPTPYGIWKSTDGGVNWAGVITTTNRLNGATDLVMDPQDPDVLYASFWSRGISKTVDGGLTWTSVMTGFPSNADYTLAPSRFALGISRPATATSATLYAGFEWYDTNQDYHPPTIWKSTNDGASWSQVPDVGNIVTGYCLGVQSAGSQCWYDNEIGVDPSNPNIVYALGLFNYATGAGGIFRSMDGGTHWTDLGYGLHPDFHSIAIRRDNPTHIVIGNDGGVWSSANRGGRLNPGDPLSAVDWTNLNGTIDPVSGAVLDRSGLEISQFSSINQNPTVPTRLYGGLQDNGTLRKSSASETWFDVGSGDGGHVLVDPTDPNYVYGSYPQAGVYRFTDGAANFFSNESIATGIDQNDRVAFYQPWLMDPSDPNRLYLGTHRVYRTDNAKAPNASDVLWTAISPDLTSGCPGRITNANLCNITALGATAGAPALYVGTGDGQVWLSANATSAAPTWQSITTTLLPIRPVSAFAIDRSNYRLAYMGYSGFSAATPTKPGHVFKTTNGGQTWTNVTSNLPDVPINSLILDASDPNILYAGTDVGPYLTTNGGASWSFFGGNFPIVAVAELNLNPYTRQLVAGTYGRGAWAMGDNATPKPALKVRVSHPDQPVGPNGLITYTITIKNGGNISATNVSIVDPLPANTTFVSASAGGSTSGGNVIWTIPLVPQPTLNPTGGPLASVGLLEGSVSVSVTVRVANSGVGAGTVITHDGVLVSSVEVPPVSSSPDFVTLAPANAVQITPASQSDGARSGQTITYFVTVRNLAYNSDAYTMTVTGNQWPTTFWDATLTTPLTRTPTLAPGMTTTVGIKVSIPVTASNGTVDTATVRAISVGNPSVSGAATIRTTAVTYRVLLVDNDDGNPDVESYYTATLQAAGAAYNYWDLGANPNLSRNYLTAHDVVVWFTGGSYPDPFGRYDSDLQALLDGGGRLFMSSFDGLDQAAGETPFVLNYLHIDWDDPSDNDVDPADLTVTAVPTNTVTGGMGTISVTGSTFGYCDCNDVLTLISPATAAFTSTNGVNALTVTDVSTTTQQTYKVVFLAFPFEALGTANDRAELMKRTLEYFDVTFYKLYLPLIARQ